jgi:FemAB family
MTGPTSFVNPSQAPYVDASEVVDSVVWDSTVAAMGGGVFNSTAWARYRETRDGAAPLFVRWLSSRDATEPIALAVGFRAPNPLTWQGRLVRRLDFDTAPASRSEDHHPDLLAPLLAWSRRHKLVDLRLGSFDAQVPWSVRGLPQAVGRFEFLVQPANPPDLLKAMRKGARSSIRRAERLGVSANSSTDPSAVRSFCDLHTATMRRLRERKGIDQRPPDEVRLADELSILISNGAGRVYLATFERKPVAGAFFATFAQSAYYLLSGASDYAGEIGATGLVLYAALSELSNHNYTRLNLGGVSGDADRRDSPDHGLYSFKKGLGGQPIRVVGGRLPIRPMRSWLTRQGHRALGSVLPRD